ncbi:MAG: helix-turn-helix domain-containing protein, partial [Nocardioides sp.]
GANRVSASRLWDIAQVLEVPVSYFFDGVEGAVDPDAAPAEPPTDVRPGPLAEDAAPGCSSGGVVMRPILPGGTERVG